MLDGLTILFFFTSISFEYGVHSLNNHTDDLLLCDMLLYIYIVVKRDKFSENKVLHIVNVELEQVKLYSTVQK